MGDEGQARTLCQTAADHLAKQQFEDALDDAMLAAKLAPELVDAWTTLAQAQSGLGHHRAAAAAYRKAVELAPQDPKLAALAAAAEKHLQQTQQDKYSTMSSSTA